MDVGVFVIRVFLGSAIAAHGAQKLFGWFGGYGIKGTGGFFETMGFRPGAAFAAAAGLSELGGGVLMTVGLFTPLGAAAVLSAMIVAMVSVHLKNGFFASANGIEMPFLYGVGSLAMIFTGGGAISADGLLRLTFPVQPYFATGLLVLALGAAAITLGMRRVEASAPSKS